MSGLEPLAGELVDYAVKPNFRALGRRFGAQTKAVAAALAEQPAAEVAAAVLAGGTFGVGRRARRAGGAGRRTT